MPTWRVRTTSERYWTLEYLRPGTMGVFHCGLLRRDTDLRLVVAFVIDADAARPGDLILLPGHRALQLLRPAPGTN